MIKLPVAIVKYKFPTPSLRAHFAKNYSQGSLKSSSPGIPDTHCDNLSFFAIKFKFKTLKVARMYNRSLGIFRLSHRVSSLGFKPHAHIVVGLDFEREVKSFPCRFSATAGPVTEL